MMAIREKIKASAKENLPYLLIFLLIFLLLFFYLFNSIVITIGPGEAGVLFKRFSGGTVVDKVYPEGINIIFPWNRMHIYNVRVQQVGHDFSVLTKNGLKIDLFISIRYHPEYLFLGVLHKKVGPDYVDAIVIPEIEQVMRVLLGRLSAEEVYRTKRAIIAKAINEAIDQIARLYVRVDDVIIKMIRLPETVEQAIQDKMTQKHMADAYRYKLLREIKEAERKEIEARGLKAYNEIVGSSLSKDVLQWLGVRATLELSKSKNAKVVVIGSGEKGLPIIGTIPMEHLKETAPTGPSADTGLPGGGIGSASTGIVATDKASDAPVITAPPDTFVTPKIEEKKGNDKIEK
jgi:regulator of protease activity HflC (stomatin/prohibitin superfamily)